MDHGKGGGGLLLRCSVFGRRWEQGAGCDQERERCCGGCGVEHPAADKGGGPEAGQGDEAEEQ